MNDHEPERHDAQPPAPENPPVLALRIQRSDGVMSEFIDAVNALGADSAFVLAGLTEFLRTQNGVQNDGLGKEREQYLIASGTFAADELTAARRDVGQGGLQLRAAEAWLSHLYATLSLDQAAAILGRAEADVRTAASEGRLHAVEVAGRLRFPDWQFSLGSPSKLLPGLTQIIQVVTPRWTFQSAAGFFATPQSSLVAEGPQTPAQWLRGGGDVRNVIEIVEASDWS